MPVRGSDDSAISLIAPCAAAAVMGRSTETASSPRPNIILCDDLGYGDEGAFFRINAPPGVIGMCHLSSHQNRHAGARRIEVAATLLRGAGVCAVASLAAGRSQAGSRQHSRQSVQCMARPKICRAAIKKNKRESSSRNPTISRGLCNSVRSSTIPCINAAPLAQLAEQLTLNQ